MTVTRRPSPLAAATLSLVLPGLGEWLVGARERALLIAVPALAVGGFVCGAIASAYLEGGRDTVLSLLLRPEVLVALIVVDLGALIYHDAAIVDAWLVARHRRGPDRRRLTRFRAIAGVAVVLALATGAHGAIAALGVDAEATLQAVVPGDEGGRWAIPDTSFEPGPTPAPTSPATPPATPAPAPSATASAAPTPMPSPSPTPAPTPAPAWAEDGRLNLLIVGTDAGPDRWLLRTDSMIVLSVDVATGRAALFGIPRNMTGVPLPPESRGAFADGRFPGMLNALYVYAWGHPSQFPGGDARGFRAVTGAVQELIGVRLDAFVALDLRGFVELVDALGGLWIQVPERLVDSAYPKIDGSGTVRIAIEPGCHHLDGEMALAYARSRHQDSDYGRMQRQQQVLLALRGQLDPAALLPQVPALLQAARDHLWTTISQDDLPSLVELAARVKTSAVATVRFVPSAYPEHLTTAEIGRIRAVVRDVFTGPAPQPSATDAGPSCP